MSAEKTTVHLGLVGDGRLYEALRQHLTDRHCLQELQQENLATQASQCAFVIVCSDNWSSALREETQMLAQMRQVAWLPIYSEFDSVFVGPCTLPNRPGCFTCAQYRRECAMEEIETFRRFRERLEQIHQPLSQPWLTSWVVRILLPVIEMEVAHCLQSPEEARTVQAVLQLNLLTLRWDHHRFLPDPSCAICGDLPADSAEGAAIQLQTRQKLAPTTFRVRSLSQLAEQIGSAYIDESFGLFQQPIKRTRAVCPITSVFAHMEQRGRRRSLKGFGRTLNHKQSCLAAIAEILERYGGQLPQGKRTVVRASFRQLGDQAIDPVTLGLPAPEQYALPGSTRIPYHQDLVCDWVWGYSFGQQRPILIPEFYAYYGLPEKQAFAYETSNGCALGSCLEEAILYALLEVVERDAFLLTWYAQLGVPQVDLRSLPDQRIRWVIEHLEYTSGYRFSLFNTTLLHGVPCCWVMAVDENERPGFPKMIGSAGSHFLPEEAILSALLELAAMLRQEQEQEQFQQERQKALEMLRDPLQVEEMMDHPKLYMLPESFEYLHFLSRTPHQQTFQEAFGAFLQPAFSLDLTEDLTRLIAYYQQQGIDTIVVDQTTPEHQVLGFHCVKVIMPGMLPMTFGHRNRRVHGFKRLAEWPMLLGYRADPLPETEINPHPHPFA